MKKRKKALFAIFPLAAVLGVSAYFFRNIPPSIPPFDQALFIYIGGNPPAIEIGKDDLGQLRQIFETANRERFPKKWAASGVVELRNDGVKVSTIQVFTNLKGPGHFEMQGVYYLGYDQESFQEILERSKRADIP